MIPLHDDNPTQIVPVITVALIALCVVAFVVQLSLGEEGNSLFIYRFGMIPAVLLDYAQLPPEVAKVPAELTVLTSMFLHGGFMHIGGNMLYLWVFGNNIEDAMGHVRFVGFYVLCGIAAAGAQTFSDTGSEIPMIGASGAISGVLGAYLLLYPHARVLTLIPLGFYVQSVRIRAVWVLGFWFAVQIFQSLVSVNQEGGVAWYAHIGGFVAGMALIPLFKYRHVPLLQKAHGAKRWHKRMDRRFF